MKYDNKWHIASNIIIVAVCFAACLAAGYGLSLLIFGAVGTPPAFPAFMISSLLGVAIFGCVARIISNVVLKGHQHARMEQFDKMVEAMGKIARGDFSASVAVDNHDPFSEVAESVNKMARKLGSMETLRQDFISNVSHEIQSPLTSISGFAVLLKTDTLSLEQRTHYLDIIETESKRLSKLSDNLLKLSSLESKATPLMPQEFRLDRQVRNAVLMLEPQWSEKNITVDAELEKVTVNADEDLLNQVWINLLHNAVKFTPQGGEIRVSLIEQDGLLECRISDNGIGIPEADRIHIFERFYKVDKSRDRSLGGNGLGLSLCKKIVELHGGTILSESEPGGGTAFIVSLKK